MAHYVVALTSYFSNNVLMHQVSADTKRVALLKGLHYLSRVDIIVIMGSELEGEPDYNWQSNPLFLKANDFPDYEEMVDWLRTQFGKCDDLNPPMSFNIMEVNLNEDSK